MTPQILLNFQSTLEDMYLTLEDKILENQEVINWIQTAKNLVETPVKKLPTDPDFWIRVWEDYESIKHLVE